MRPQGALLGRHHGRPAERAHRRALPRRSGPLGPPRARRCRHLQLLRLEPENDAFFFADTLDGAIDRFDYDHETGALSGRRRIVDLSGEGISPDGSTIDAEGFLWNAQWDGWRLARYAPDGRLDRLVELPVQKPTSCMFGGPDLRTLYVTSAIWDLTPEQFQAQPQAGGLFALDVGVAGVPEPRFAG